MLDDPEVTEYVNRVGQNIALHSDVPYRTQSLDFLDLLTYITQLSCRINSVLHPRQLAAVFLNLL